MTIAIIAGTVFGTWVLLAALRVLRRWRELHHGYLGVLLLVAGLLLEHPWAMGIGALLLADDAFQHWVQLLRPLYRSPLHRLYGATLYRVPCIRTLNQRLDAWLA